MNTTLKTALCILALVSLTGAAVAKDNYGDKRPAMDIVETAIAAGSFGTLVTAVQAAGLVETLKGPGPFTVFAPTDAAFAKLPAGTVEALLADKAKLTGILTYHVVAGKLMAADVLAKASLTTVQGGAAAVDAKKATIAGATIIKTDIVCSNGVIHVIDAVMLP